MIGHTPAKYDQFVDVGMAAWVESDPYNLWPDWPSGYLTDWPWSNLPYTLAYSDGYVWVWAAHTHYSASKSVVNPFLASIANRTFNTGQEQASTFTETLPSDPLGRGWYFDFDMLNIGRRLDGGPLFPFLPPMSLDSVPYRWDATNQAVRVQGAWRTGEFGERVGVTSWQRRRYVRPADRIVREVFGEDIGPMPEGIPLDVPFTVTFANAQAGLMAPGSQPGGQEQQQQTARRVVGGLLDLRRRIEKELDDRFFLVEDDAA